MYKLFLGALFPQPLDPRINVSIVQLDQDHITHKLGDNVSFCGNSHLGDTRLVFQSKFL